MEFELACSFGNRSRASRRSACALGALIACGVLAPLAHAQTSKLGHYSGTISMSETVDTPNDKRKIQATAKVVLPISTRSPEKIYAEFLAGEAPDGTVLVTQYETFRRETSADSGGQYPTTQCTLVKPIEVPASVTGVLAVDTRTKKQAVSITVLGKKDIPLNCTHSRSGAGKQNTGITVYAGTGDPGDQHRYAQPFSDPAHLTGKRITQPEGIKADAGRITEEWDLRLAP